MKTDDKKKKEIESGFQEYVQKEKIQPDAEGRYYDGHYGDYITPVIWAAMIMPQLQRKDDTVPPASQGYRGGNCACACVSCACACACACAGGGAAGCSKKTLHECERCRKGMSKTEIKTKGKS
jgi:hypothetical protein